MDRYTPIVLAARPDVILTWGPEAGMGHPDHRIISNIVTQLQRAGADGDHTVAMPHSLPGV
jgi:LmbE family N-acetylglucosaminyl deacetylase